MAQKLLSLDQDKKIRELAVTMQYTRKQLAEFFPEFTFNQINNYCNDNNIRTSLDNKWTEDEIKLVKKLCGSGNYYFSEMEQFFPNRTKHKIAQYCFKNNIINKKDQTWSDEDLNKFKEMVSSGMFSMKQMAKKFSKSMDSIRWLMKRFNLKQIHRASRYSFDQDYFNLLTLNNCYWAGFFMADACLHKKNNSNIFQIALSKLDEKHLEKFKNEIRSSHPLRKSQKYSRDGKRILEYVTLSIGGIDKWLPNMEKYFGFIERKTKRFPPPKLETIQQKLAFLRGYIDGDGSISTIRNKTYINISIASSNYSILEWVKNLIDSLNLPYINKGTGNNIKKRSEESCFDYKINSFKCSVLFQILSNLDIPRLERKWDNPIIWKIINENKHKEQWPGKEYFGRYK